MYTAPQFTVTSAALTSTERYIDVIYIIGDIDGVNKRRISAKAFEHYLNCLHTVDCPNVIDWMGASTDEQIFLRIAGYMQCIKNERDAQETKSLEYRQHIGVL